MSKAVNAVKLTSEENLRNNVDTYKNANRVHTHPQAVEPYDREWGIGISGNTPDPSPFPRINRILSVTSKSTNGEVSADRAVLYTEAYKAPLCRASASEKCLGV